MAAVIIDVSRPAGALGPFSRPVTLSRTRYVLAVHPSARGGGGLWASLYDVAGAPLVGSVRLLVGVPDILAQFRARVLGLPPGRLYVDALADPQPEDLSAGTFRLVYEE